MVRAVRARYKRTYADIMDPAVDAMPLTPIRVRCALVRRDGNAAASRHDGSLEGYRRQRRALFRRGRVPGPDSAVALALLIGRRHGNGH